MACDNGSKVDGINLSSLTQILRSVTSLRQLNLQTIKHAMAELITSSQRSGILHRADEHKQDVQNQQQPLDHNRRILPRRFVRLVQI